MTSTRSCSVRCTTRRLSPRTGTRWISRQRCFAAACARSPRDERLDHDALPSAHSRTRLTMDYAAAVIPAPHEPLRVERFPAPSLEPGAALLHVLYSEVCGTDVHLHHGRLAGVPYPVIPGHVSVGVIAGLGSPLQDIEGRAFNEGDVVTFLDVHGTCGACYHCLV